ncbi:DegT/DnrJ/EryC1/StrS family aminotransferase [Turicibacter sanguinis]|uniref:Aminotransferase class I/II-fold pyridoxal phosphate-dependent enzyme n=1 Tax=Turicibacter sanguinis TaxID=154288 RepID=A0A6G2CRC1_9FIRM|nr:aminotransferase class I/II-fold pyridoxal phosphate-dependent enzyme [Turicibacter sanguinis]MTK70802.1 aminotransferase class I/II-fold pyridoxal phosphate-dependent enzyme [Turicibacter sanguinis]MTK81919.1 aminotransferase class I/II-fold pyridoxal phosphate-dependent enzyme [Turicibacter sanguinis]MTK84243.1 aminotransferase class I/II-fold pyridoxal phosphate-dependent enzyme [Turicibacter sanguinis]MTK86689.1 aminotransferase class I/II-fold pyridoxal phosphate-dependent enzyme [Turic
MERIYLASPHMSDEGYEQAYIKEAFESNWVAPLGPNVTNFEKELAEYVDVKSASALSSGTAAIHLGLKALGVTQGDVVFCSTLTFSASCNPIIYCGAEPVFIDSDSKTWNMCPKALELAFEDAVKNNKLPKAVVVVNLYGQSADMDPILEICQTYNVPILEDAAESLGATYKGRMSGTIGDIGIYSFNGNKIITTSGGGMMVSNNEEYTKKATFWATQSRENERHYEHKEIGYNYRMSNVVAGIGRGQLKVLNDRIAKKKEIYETYKEAFKDIEDIEMMNICDFGESNYWLSVMTLKETSKVKPIDIMLALEKENIESRPVWKPMHMQLVFNQYKFFTSNEEISVSEDLFNRGVCLPSDTKITEDQLLHVIKLMKELFN